MKRIHIENSEAIFLDHYQLINAAYRKYVENGEIYEIKPQLFNFVEKSKVESDTHEKTNKQRKRKHLQIEPLSKESLQLQTVSGKFLEQLLAAGEFPKDITSAPLQRYWEQSHEFPQFNGVNTLAEWKSFNLNDNLYLIPPKCAFFNYNVSKLPQLLPVLSKFDLIVIDSPWRNKYIRRLKRVRNEANLAYDMLDNDTLQQMPIAELIGKETLVAIWCTNSELHQKTLINDFLPHWNLRLLHTIKWLKLNASGKMIGPLSNSGQKQPYEMLYIACHLKAVDDFCSAIKKVELILSVPSIVHSHKPPLYEWLKLFLPSNPKCLELFARYVQPGFTSIGLEVLKLMDGRLYESQKSKD